MATNTTPARLDPDDYGPTNPPRATVHDAQRYPQDNTHRIQPGVVYEGRINNVTDSGRAYVALDSPYTASDVNGILDPENQLTTRFFVGDEVYVMALDVTSQGGVFQEVEVVGDETKSSFHEPETDAETDAEPTTDEPEPGWADAIAAQKTGGPVTDPDETETAADGDGEGDADTDTDPDDEVVETGLETGGVVGFVCPLCPDDDPDDDRDVFNTPRAVRTHITKATDARHTDRIGTDTGIEVLPVDKEGRVVDTGEDATTLAPGDGEGDVTLSFGGEVADTPLDAAIIRDIITHPGTSEGDVISRFEAYDHGKPYRFHVRGLASGLSADTSGIDTLAWASRENLAKLYYYYGLTQADIAARYDADATEISKTMSSMDINPGKGGANAQSTFDRLADTFDYDWATDMTDRGEGSPDDMPDDDDIVAPLTADEPDTDAEADTDDTDMPTQSDADDADSTDDTDDTVHTTSGNASYTGPATGIDGSVQYIGERPARGGTSTDDEGDEPEDVEPSLDTVEIPDHIAAIPDDAFPEQIYGKNTAPVSRQRAILALIDAADDPPTKLDLRNHPAMSFGGEHLANQLRALDRAGILDREKDTDQRGAPYVYTLADTSQPDAGTDDDVDDVVTDILADERDLNRDTSQPDGDTDDADPEPAPEPESTPTAGDAWSFDWDDVDANVVMDGEAERARADAERLLTDAGDVSVEMEMYAKGQLAMLDKLGLDAGDDAE